MCYMSIFLFDVGSTHGHGPNGLGLDLCPDLEHGLSLGHGPDGLDPGHSLDLNHGHGPVIDLGFWSLYRSLSLYMHLS